MSEGRNAIAVRLSASARYAGTDETNDEGEVMYRVLQTWGIGEYEFKFVEMKHDKTRYYGFDFIDRKRGVDELYDSLDEAMVAAIGEKYTARRGASSSNGSVGTAADWFMKMIGAHKQEEK